MLCKCGCGETTRLAPRTASRIGWKRGLTEEDITEVIRVKRVDNGKLDDRLWFETVLVLRKACPVPVPGVPGTGA